jgi:hypothetical protein
MPLGFTPTVFLVGITLISGCPFHPHIPEFVRLKLVIIRYIQKLNENTPSESVGELRIYAEKL